MARTLRISKPSENGRTRKGGSKKEASRQKGSTPPGQMEPRRNMNLGRR